MFCLFILVTSLLLNLCVCSNKDANFDTLKTPPHGTAGRYKPTTTGHGATLGSLANGSVNRAVRDSVPPRNNLDELQYNVTNRYNTDDVVEL